MGGRGGGRTFWPHFRFSFLGLDGDAYMGRLYLAALGYRGSFSLLVVANAHTLWITLPSRLTEFVLKTYPKVWAR